MRIRQARKILLWGRGDWTVFGSPHRAPTMKAARKRVEKWLGGYAGMRLLGLASGLE